MKNLLLFFISCFLVIFSSQLTAQKKSTKGWLGVVVSDYESALGAYVVNVLKESPADSVGIKRGDVIIRVDKKDIATARDLTQAIKDYSTGKNVEIVVLRKGKELKFNVILASQPRYLRRVPVHRQMLDFYEQGKKIFGMKLHSLTPQLAEYFGAPEKEGVLVEEVEEGSVASEVGIHAGDVIIKVGRKHIDEARDVIKELLKYEDGQKVSIEFIRNREKKSVEIVISEEDLRDHPLPLQLVPFGPPRLENHEFFYKFNNRFL